MQILEDIVDFLIRFFKPQLSCTLWVIMLVTFVILMVKNNRIYSRVFCLMVPLVGMCLTHAISTVTVSRYDELLKGTYDPMWYETAEYLRVNISVIFYGWLISSLIAPLLFLVREKRANLDRLS